MGMDVYGLAPTSEIGKYFRNNVWWWRPLASYIQIVAQQESKRCTHWQSNDGDGLDGPGATQLAEALQAEIDSGRTAAYSEMREAELEALPDLPCWLCDATGTRKRPPERGAGALADGGMVCNVCDGSGKVRPDETQYPFSVDNVQEFILFLRDCGGFEIW